MDTAADSRPVKCVIWDLDNTLWDGVLLEDPQVRPRTEVLDAIRALDERGILHSIASRNDPATARAKLDELGIGDLFLHPQINWGSKAESVAAIARRLNLNPDALVFVDDQVFEREEVNSRHPTVRCFDATEAAGLPALPAFHPRFVTGESRQRRQMYRADIDRDDAAAEFTGTSEEFLATLGMVFTIAPATTEDLRRAEELTVRTHQLNTTGRTYSYTELEALQRADDHLLLLAELTDRFGSYGKIGLALVELGPTVWRLKLLLMSCRVMSRGVGTVLLNEIQRLAAEAGVRLQADFVSNDRNRMMYVTYRMGGFREVHRDGDEVVLEGPPGEAPASPPYLTVRGVAGGENAVRQPARSGAG
ncbi:HAD-IIIC family phosphatase [Micromonospora eburnea]|uniref:HAD-superfamily phosphatase, subfamily IIIC/FkbH-like domain-containing protein n=1 Tax=Micromonospora eburnea TaxID=227316 RepID=A0A1C6UVS2_9ACTN|nr:HAD-IIIC family phosphatase [Micromonospora eburnea]SCL57909.1 HAD-superfamily phosphatase, subfamily IIIC/FkbH-like domain-containing protein [Micromonospora eburnea]